jgi:hypothetical protein
MTINNSYDFGVVKRLRNLPKLREIGFAPNRRLLERLSHDCMLAEDTFQAINSPVAAGRQRAVGQSLRLCFATARRWQGKPTVRSRITQSAPYRDAF